MSNTKSPGPRPTFIPSGILIHPAIWPQQIWAGNWGLRSPLGMGELGPHLTQCGRGWGLPAWQVSSWHIQPFGHNKPTLETDRTYIQTTVWWHRANRFTNGRPKRRTRMWANAQRDGRAADYRWRPLFNAAKFRWRRLLECRAVTLLRLPRRESRWIELGCPKLTKRCQPLVGRSSPYCKDMWGR